MSDISFLTIFSNQLLLLTVTLLTGIYNWSTLYDWLTKNGNLLFSGVVAVSTVVYAILTWILVSETRKMRKVQTEPSLHLFIESRDEHNEITDMFIQNIGMGVARNIKFEVLSDFMYYKSGTSSHWLKDIHILGNGLEALAPNQKIRVFSTSYRDVKDLNSKTYFEIGIKYTNYIGDKYDSVYLLDFLTLPPIGMSMHDHMSDAIREMNENIKNISSNIGKYINYSMDSEETLHIDYCRFLFATKDDNERIEISKYLIKEALLRFYYDWKTSSWNGHRVDTDPILNLQSSNLLEIIAAANGSLPEKLIEEILSLSNEMKELSSRVMYIHEYEKQFEKIADDVFSMYNNLYLVSYLCF